MNNGLIHSLRGLAKLIFLTIGGIFLLPGIYLLLDGLNLRFDTFSQEPKMDVLKALFASGSLIIVGVAFLTASMLLIFHALNDSSYSRKELRIMRIAFSFVSGVAILLLALSGAQLVSSQEAQNATARGVGIFVTALLVGGGLALLLSMACIARAIFAKRSQL